MNKKVVVLIVSLALIGLLIGAKALYGWSSGKQTPDRLSVNDSAPHTHSDECDHDSDTALAPDFTVYDAQGNPVQLSDFFGKPIVLNFWASWCGPCQMEMPDFQAKYQELGDSVQFLMVNMTGGRETLSSAKAFIADKGYTFPVFYDTDTSAAVAYSAYSLPTTYLIDADGHVIAQAVGAIDAATLQKGIDMIR